MSVLIETSFGDIVIDLFTKKAPLASINFLKLCKIKFYNNALFAEVQKNYVTQVTTEQPSTIWAETKQGEAVFKDEIDMEGKVNDVGLVVTANIGSNLNNSNFFITLTKANLTSLNGKHTVFGKVEEGL